jgi:Zn-dependent protease with chaperone function
LLNVNFTQEEVARSRRYHRPLYGIRLAALAIGLAVPLALVLIEPGDALSPTWWLEVIALAALVVAATTVTRLPLSVWRLRHERRWGFSTQSTAGWIADRAKALAIAVVITSGALLGLVGSARLFPSWWPLVAALGAAALVALLTFVAPIVLEPVFNRFRPLEDERLAGELRGLAERAGVPVRDVLVADASRRTRKHNAYVSGLGRTRRVVLWDTLLAGVAEPELKVVVAHELGHRRFRHVAWGTVLGMAGAGLAVIVLWGLGLDVADPGVVPAAVLVFTALELASLPLGATISRAWERGADRFSIDLTGDAEAYRRLHYGLARDNLADLDPPRAYHLAFHGHPTAPERLAASERKTDERERV